MGLRFRHWHQRCDFFWKLRLSSVLAKNPLDWGLDPPEKHPTQLWAARGRPVPTSPAPTTVIPDRITGESLPMRQSQGSTEREGKAMNKMKR